MFKLKEIRTLCSFVLFLIGFTGICQPCCDDKILKYPLKSITTYCQSDTEKVYTEQVLTYDLKRKLINSATYNSHSKPQMVVYKYSKDGQLVSKEFSTIDQPVDRVRIFEYDGNKRLAFDGFDDDGGNNTQNSYYYDQRGILLSHTVTCNDNKVQYTFNYDNQDRLIRRYKNNVLETSFQYEAYGNLKKFIIMEAKQLKRNTNMIILVN